MRQAYQTPFATDVVEPSKQKPAKTTCFLDLAKHRFHDHLAPGVQCFPFGRLHFCGHTRLRCGGFLRHGRPWIMMAPTPGGHVRIESQGLQCQNRRLAVIATVQSRRDGLGGTRVVPWESLNPLRGAPTAGNRGTAVLSSGLAAGRGIRPRCGASCPFGSLDRGVCGLVVGDDTPWCPRTASIPLGRLPSPAPPPLAVGGSMDCCCPSAAASLTLGDHSGPAPLRPVPPHDFGGCHAPTQVPLVTPRP